MKRHNATPESIAEYHERQRAQPVAPTPMRDGLTKEQLMSALKDLPRSDYEIPEALMPKAPT